MTHRYEDGLGRSESHRGDGGHRKHSGHHLERQHKGRPGRMFDYGELRVLVLAMIAEQPCHGYELMRALEERTAGGYSPSPGVTYPTLAWLEDMGYAAVEVEGRGRKSYCITPEGEAFNTANSRLVENLLARITSPVGRPHGAPTPVIRGMENLKIALRLRLKNGPVDRETADKISAALDAAALAVERS